MHGTLEAPQEHAAETAAERMREADMLALRGKRRIRELDNPAWNSLSQTHLGLGLGAVYGHAARYAPDISPIAALEERSLAAYADLAYLATEGECFSVLQAGAPPEHIWRVLDVAPLTQWICPAAVAPVESAVEWVDLDRSHGDAMKHLADLTDPGPFERLTYALGDYIGVFDAGELVAMAGERFRMAGFREISAVCTHPDYAGRGYAQVLVRELALRQQRRNCVPFLYVRTGSPCEAAARRVYEKVGFVKWRDVAMATLERQ